MRDGRAGRRKTMRWGLGLALAAALGLASVVLLGGGAPGGAGSSDGGPGAHRGDPIQQPPWGMGTDPVDRERVTLPDPGGNHTGRDPGQEHTLSVELTGVSPALIPHLGVVLHALQDPPHRHAAPVDTAGIATLRGPLPERVQLSLLNVLLSDLQLRDAADGSFTWNARPGMVVRARPEEPVVGVRRAARPDGVTPLLKLAFAPEQETGPARQTQVARRAHVEAADWLYVWSPDTGGFRVRPEELVHAADDLWLADPARGEALARLRLEVPADRVEAAQRMRLHLQTIDGADRIYLHLSREDLWQGQAFRTDRIPAGAWRVEWRSGARSCGLLAERVVLRAGEETVLSGAPPAMVQWRGEVANWAQVPAPLRMRRHLFVSGTLAAVDDEGRFVVELPAELTPAELGIVFREEPGARRLAGRVVTYDPPAGTLVVAHPPVDDFGTVTVGIEPLLPDAERHVVVLRGLDRRVPALHRASWHFHGGYRVAVENGAVELPRWDSGPLVGALVETVDRRDQVTAWFAVPQGVTQHAVRGGGRQVTLHLHRDVARAQVYVKGPADQPALFVAEQRGPGELPVWVVPGTSAVLVDLGHGQVERLAPLGDELHVW